MIKLINKSKLKSEKIEGIISLLPKEYSLPKENCFLHMTHCLFHEFRHLYQSKQNNQKHINNEISPKNLKSADDFKNYIHDENEIDAENFADSFYDENKTEIDRIWDITFEYEIKKKIVDL